MSHYSLSKLIREVNRDPITRERYLRDPSIVIENYELTNEEKTALIAFDLRKLYALGVHGLLLRPFTIIHKISEPDYLKAIRSRPPDNP
jgi:hypothetical protein